MQDQIRGCINMPIPTVDFFLLYLFHPYNFSLHKKSKKIKREQIHVLSKSYCLPTVLQNEILLLFTYFCAQVVFNTALIGLKWKHKNWAYFHFEVSPLVEKLVYLKPSAVSQEILAFVRTLRNTAVIHETLSVKERRESQAESGIPPFMPSPTAGPLVCCPACLTSLCQFACF